MSHAAALEPSVPPTRELPAVPRHGAAGAHLPTPDRTDGPSVAAFVAGLLGLVVPLLCVLAIVLGSLGVGRAAHRGTRGRGLAKAGLVLGVLEVAFTVVVGAGVWFVWRTYGDDLRDGLAQVSAVSAHADVALLADAERLADGDLGAAWALARDLGPSGIVELASNAGELRDLAGLCQGGDTAACGTLLDRLPDGFSASS